MARKRLPAEQRKETLLKAAQRCIARKGYYSATTADISAEAGVTEPVLYQHFTDKQELVDSMLSRTTDELLSFVNRRTQAKEDPLERIRENAASIFDFTRRNRNKMRAQFYSIPEMETGGMRRFQVDLLHMLQETVYNDLQEARLAGRIRADLDCEDFAWSFVSLVTVILFANALYLDLLFKNKEGYLELIDRLLSTATVTAVENEEGDD